MNTLRHFIFLSALLVIFLSGCETDFDTTTEYEDITVVYGILDQKSSEQFIKINKAFLSEADILTYANNPDSNQYMIGVLEVSMQELDQSGAVVKTYTFDTTAVNKDDGIFYNEGQILYKWNRPNLPIGYDNVMLGSDTLAREPLWLNENRRYKLIIKNTQTGKEISAETVLVQEFSITKPGFGKKINFVLTPANPKVFTWNSADNGGKYEFELRFTYRELSFGSTDTVSKAITLTRSTVNSVAGSGELNAYYLDNNFYNACKNLIPYKDQAVENNIKERYTDLVEIIVKVAEENLTLYMDVNAPSTGIIQEKPEYSNINNGIGIFSSRYYEIKVKELDDQTVAELKKIETPNLKFRF